MKNRVATKIIAKNQKVNTVQAKYFKVKVLTKSGKKVNGGTIKIIGKICLIVKNALRVFRRFLLHCPKKRTMLNKSTLSAF